MHISPLTIHDCEKAAFLHQNSFYKGWDFDTFKVFLQDKLIFGLKVEIENEFCGFILWREVVDEGEILTLVVAPKWQEMGIGSHLLQSIYQILMKKKITRLFLEVAEDNQKAISFYEKHGFVYMSKRPQYYPREDNRFVSAMNFVKEFL